MAPTVYPVAANMRAFLQAMRMKPPHECNSCIALVRPREKTRPNLGRATSPQRAHRLRENPQIDAFDGDAVASSGFGHASPSLLSAHPRPARDDTMINRSRPSISVKLVISFALLLLSLVAVTVIAWQTLDAVESSARRIASHYAPQVTRISDAQMAMFRLSLESRHAMLSKTPEELEQTLQRIGTLRKQMLDNLDTFEDNLTTEMGRERFRKIREADATFWRLGGEVLGKVKSGEIDAAFAQLKGELVPARDTMVAAIAEQRLWQERLIIDAVEAASAAAFRTKIVVVALSLLTFGLALWVAWSLTRMISGAFARARAITERIADGDLSSEIYVKPGDEFGYLFASLANMQSSLVKVIGGVRRVAAQVTQAAQQIDRATTTSPRRPA